MAKKKDPRLARAGVSGYNKPKRTPNHKTKSHVVVAKGGDKVKTIRFGQQGVLEKSHTMQGIMHKILNRLSYQQDIGLTKLNGRI